MVTGTRIPAAPVTISEQQVRVGKTGKGARECSVRERSVRERSVGERSVRGG